MYFRPRLLTLLALLLQLISISGYSSAQSLEPGNNSLLQSNPRASFASKSLDAVGFLPVEEAYRLSASRGPDDRLTLHWDIADGYYLYRKQLSFSVAGQTLQAELPPGLSKYDEYFEEELVVYYHDLDIELNLDRVTAEPFTLEVRSQGCADAGLCYPPHTQQLRIEGDRIDFVSMAGSAPPNSTSGSAGTTQSPGAAQPFDGGKLLVALLAAVMGGVILNLMPCVFPVLSLKALGLAKARLAPYQQHLHGWAYTAGAVSLFIAIAALMLVLRQAGFAIGWGFQLQTPWFVGLLAYLFFSMALMLSGNFSLAARWSGTGQQLTEGHSLAASYFTGALACIVASPCTAPFMGTALGFAITQPAYIALTVFAALGLGMALPFLLLSYYPKLNRIMPRPGPWMETFKQLLAFPLYLTALWLLWVLGRQAGSDAVIGVLGGGIAIALALWLMSFSSGLLLRLTALASLTLAALPLLRVETSVVDNSGHYAGPWQPYTQQRLSQLTDANNPVFINLTADWCITCLVNEKVVLSSPAIHNALADAGVVLLKGDWTNYNPEITTLLARFNRSGVPLYLFYPADPEAEPIVLPQILTTEIVLNTVSANILAINRP